MTLSFVGMDFVVSGSGTGNKSWRNRKQEITSESGESFLLSGDSFKLPTSSDGGIQNIENWTPSHHQKNKQQGGYPWWYYYAARKNGIALPRAGASRHGQIRSDCENVRTKIARHPAFGDLPDRELNYVTVTLSDKDAFKKAYLSPQRQRVLDDPNRTRGQQKDVDKETGIATWSPGSIEETLKGDLEVKLLITKMGNRPAFLDGAASAFNNFVHWGRYGVVHTALQIGPFIVDWNSKDLVLPRTSRNAVLLAAIRMDNIGRQGLVGRTFHAAADIANRLLNSVSFGYHLRRVNELKLDVVADYCVRWNREKSYAVHSCNCQSFVDGLLTQLKMNNAFLERSPYAPLLRNIRDGNVDDNNHPTMELTYKKRRHVFKTHRELDMFIGRLKDDWEDLEGNFQELVIGLHDVFLDRLLHHRDHSDASRWTDDDVTPASCCFEFRKGVDGEYNIFDLAAGGRS